MTVTRQEVANQFGLPLEAVTQVKSQQLFKVNCTGRNAYDSYSRKYYSCNLLVSYRTIVGIGTLDGWKLTTEKYSATTSKQLTMFLKDNIGTRVSVEEFAELLAQVGN